MMNGTTPAIPPEAAGFTPRFQTPYRVPNTTKTPRSRRVVARTRTALPGQDDTVEEHDYSGLLQSTWRIYSLSPLYRFRSSKTYLTKYARSLDAALSQENQGGGGGPEKSAFSVYEGLNFHQKDAEAVQIQVTETNFSDRTRKSIVLRALLICVDLDTSPVPENLSSQFTYYPVVMIAGNKTRTNVLLNWLECHFDCRSGPVTFSDNDLRWMLAAWSTPAVAVEKQPVLMQYSLGHHCEGICTIDCKFESSTCTELWRRLHGTSSPHEVMTEVEVNKFIDALEAHLEYCMSITFGRLNLSEVGTPVAYVSSQGKIKLLSSSSVYVALHLICEIVKDKLMEISFPLSY